jgi:hypothetical protein
VKPADPFALADRVLEALESRREAAAARDTTEKETA